MAKQHLSLLLRMILVIGFAFTLLRCGGSGGDAPAPDTESPTVPANLVASVVSSSEIGLSWSTCSDNVGVVGYTIYRDGNQIANISDITYSDKSLNPATEYCYAVSSYDAASNESALSAQACATTDALPDTIAPTVSSTAPVNGSMDVTISASVKATFSEAINPATINVATFTLEDSSNTSVTGAVSYSGLTATFVPVSALDYAMSYTATITTDVTDMAGNPMLNDYSWTFTTVMAPDITPPTVLSTVPSNGAIDVSVNTAVSATFDEAMNSATVNSTTFTVKDGLNNPVAGIVNYSGTTATFTPASAFDSSTVYTATITTGVEDLAGNAMTQDHIWSFTTGIASDTTPPTVSITTPVDGATDISTTTTVSATFSEAIDPATLDSSSFYVRYGAIGAFFFGTISYVNETATLTPVGLPYDSLLTATVTTDVKDLAGNAFVSDYSWSFTTVDAPQAALDTSFGTNGKVLTDVSGINDLSGHGDTAKDLIIQSDGKIVALGDSYNGNIQLYDFSLARYEANGVLDSNFGAGGILMTDFGGSDRFSGAVVQPDGKIIVAGSSFIGGDGNLVLARYNTDGALDTTFGIDGNGKVITDVVGNDFITDIALLPDGKILVVGRTVLGTPSGTLLARYTSGGLLDATFGTGGIIIDSTIPQMAYVNALSIQSDDKIVVVGKSTSPDIMLTRYTANGALDTTFDNDGKVITDFGGNETAEAITIAPDGKIIISGWSLNTNYTFVLARYNTDGSLDTTFDSDGKVTTGFGGLSGASSYAISIQADGKLVAAGYIRYFNDNDKPGDFAFARYNNNGSLDVTFGESGLGTVDFNAGSDSAYALCIQADGKIIAAGRSDADFALMRLLAQ